MTLEERVRKIKEYNKIMHIDAIARRYAVMNAFDGALTILGILIGGWISSLFESKIIILTTMSAAAAMAVSGIWGAYLTETAERKKELKELEHQMLIKLKGTKISEASKTAAWIVAIIDGAVPLIVSIIIISPFFILPTYIAYNFSFVIAFSILFLLGVYLGRISKENWLFFGIKMLAAGAFAAAIGFFWLIH